MVGSFESPSERRFGEEFDLFAYGPGAISIGSDRALKIILDRQRNDHLRDIVEALEYQPANIASELQPSFERMTAELMRSRLQSEGQHVDSLAHRERMTTMITDHIAVAAQGIMSEVKAGAQLTARHLERLEVLINQAIGSLVFIGDKIIKTIEISTQTNVSIAFSKLLFNPDTSSYSGADLDIIGILTNKGQAGAAGTILANQVRHNPEQLMLILKTIPSPLDPVPLQNVQSLAFEYLMQHPNFGWNNLILLLIDIFPRLSPEQKKRALWKVAEVAFDSRYDIEHQLEARLLLYQNQAIVPIRDFDQTYSNASYFMGRFVKNHLG